LTRITTITIDNIPVVALLAGVNAAIATDFLPQQKDF
jgi:hypothetical protein